MKKASLFVGALCAFLMFSQDLISQNTITSCDTTFTDIGGETANYLNGELSEWLVCPESDTSYLTIEFTYVDIEVASEAGADSTGCKDMLYIYDGVDGDAPLVGNFCGQESSDGGDAFVDGHTLKVGDSFKPTTRGGCFYMKFISNSENNLTGWRADVTCCTPTLTETMSDGINLPVETNNGAFINLEIDNSCIRKGDLTMITEFEPTGASCYTQGITLPNQTFYAFKSNPSGGFVELMIDSIDSVGEMQMAVFGPVTLDSTGYTNGVINDCVTGTDPWSMFFNAGPNQIYILATGSEFAGRLQVTTSEFSIGLGGVLPIKMEAYNLSNDGQTAHLSWTTAEEINNDGYHIYRSQTGRDFEQIGWVDAKDKAGQYHFYDKPNMSGNVYYYLKQVDNDGKETSFDILSTSFGKTQKINVFPNPSNGRFFVNTSNSNGSTEGTITVYNSIGAKVYHKNIDEYSEIDLTQMNAGIYTLQIMVDGQVETIQHIISE